MNGMLEHLTLAGGIEPADGDILARLQNVKLLAVLDDSQGNIWLGSRSGLIKVGVNGVVDEWRADDPEAPTPDGQIDTLQLAGDGSVWLSAPGGGVQQRDSISGKVMLHIPAGDDGGLDKADIEVMVISPNGNPWVAGSDGVAQLDRVHRRFKAVPELGDERVYALAFDGSDALWLQRLSGVDQYRLRNGHWQLQAHVGVDEGMPAVGAAGIRVDARHRVWVSTSRGLFRWDPVRRMLSRQSMQDSTSSQEYLDRALAMSNSGVLAAATADGGLVLVDTNAADPPGRTPGAAFRSFLGAAWWPMARHADQRWAAVAER